MSVQSVKSWFAGLSPDGKRKTFVFGAISLIILSILIGVIATDNSDRPKVSDGKKKKIEASLLTGKDPGKIGIEQLLATTKRQESQIEQLQRQLQGVANAQAGPGGQRSGPSSNGLPFPYSKSDGEVVALPGGAANSDVVAKGGNGNVSAPAVAPVKASQKSLDQAIDDDPSAPKLPNGRPASNRPGSASRRAATAGDNSAAASTQGSRDNSDVFGGTPAGPDTPSADTPPPPPPKLKLRVLTPRNDAVVDRGDASPVSTNATFTQSGQGNTGRVLPGVGNRGGSAREPEFYLPLGSIISGTLLTGMDAPAAGAASRKDPFPALLRIKHEAILPNAGLLDLRECFLVASAYGELSSQRVYLRAEGLSCQRSDGAIIEASIDAYASGADGKAGVRGIVIDKTGELIKDSLLAGFVGGLAKGFKPTQSQAVNLNAATGTAAQFQFPDPGYVAGNGILSGASGSAERIATIYEDLAKQIVPVIEINAGVPVDFIMTRGATLRFKKVGEISGTRAAGPQAGQGRADGATTSIAGTNGFSVTQGAGTSTPAIPPSGSPQTITSRRP